MQQAMRISPRNVQYSTQTHPLIYTGPENGSSCNPHHHHDTHSSQSLPSLSDRMPTHITQQAPPTRSANTKGCATARAGNTHRTCTAGSTPEEGKKCKKREVEDRVPFTVMPPESLTHKSAQSNTRHAWNMERGPPFVTPPQVLQWTNATLLD